MPMVSFKQKGDFSKLNTYLEKLLDVANLSILDKYGREGVLALERATPKDTGKTSQSWDYEIIRSPNSVTLGFSNDNFVNGVPIAIVLQYGHATGNGGYVQGRDYINPALQPIFDQIAEEAWKEVTKL